ncbi:hypothetical protein M513_06075 [Trichuris suis]|uniref:Aspartyl aminopeptidase n=1 Tax=Trichuris suis TaxID=68888 RepID=A0A085M6W3_9BILA|nr:hypothetical protein M513_06075 [Trichuris suis]
MVAAVKVCRDSLISAGFEELEESDVWKLSPRGKYFVTKNGTALIAFVLGGNFTPGRPVHMVGTHLKPNPKASCKNWQQLSVSTYGGGMWRTWFDRDLSVCGRLFVKEEDKVKAKLIHVNRPILYIPNLAIHLERESNTSFSFNMEDALKPIFAATSHMSAKHEKECDQDSSNSCCSKDMNFIGEIAQRCNIDAADIVSFELYLYPTEPAVIGGLMEDFVFGARLDNLLSTYTGLTGFMEAAAMKDVVDSSADVMVFAAFDNEEVGSESVPGAASAWTEWVLRRIQKDPNDQCSFERSMAKSFLLSADVSHAVHPNYRCKHDENHTPLFHHGPVLKVNQNQRYATIGCSAAKLRRIAELANVPVQVYTNKNDVSCGSTIGPILSTKLGIQTVDIGNALLAMHSIREMASTVDLLLAHRLFKTYYEKFHIVSSEMIL